MRPASGAEICERPSCRSAMASSLRACALDEATRRGGRPAGGEEVVQHEHAVARFHGVGVHLDDVLAVFERILFPDTRVRQFSRLADGNEPDAEPHCEGRAEDKPARFDGCDSLDREMGDTPGELAKDLCERFRFIEQRRDVPKEDARLRKIGDVADVPFQVVHPTTSKEAL